MIEPIACFNCGRPLKWAQWRALRASLAGDSLFTAMGVHREFCRIHYLTVPTDISVTSITQDAMHTHFEEVDTGRVPVSFG